MGFQITVLTYANLVDLLLPTATTNFKTLNLFICYIPFPAVFNFNNLSSFIQDAVNIEFTKNFTLKFFVITALGVQGCLFTLTRPKRQWFYRPYRVLGTGKQQACSLLEEF